MFSTASAQMNRLSEADTSEYRVNTPKMGITVYNEPYYWNPIDNGTYSARSNNRIRIDIPNTDIWNFQNGWLAADLTLSSDGIPTDGNPAYLRMGNGSWNAFERVRHLSNLSPIEEMYPYWSLYSFQWIFEQSEIIEQSFHTELGIGTQASRNTWGAITKRFIFPLDLGWISAGPFPAKYVNATQSVEFFLADPNQFIESNCGNLNFVLSNVEMHAFKMTNKFPNLVNEYRGTSWEEGFARFVRSGSYEVMLDYFDWYQNTPIAQQGDYLVPVKTAAIQSICTVFGNVLEISNPLINDRILTFPKLSVGQYQYKIFSKLYPEQPVDCRNEGFQPYQFYLNYVNAWTINGFPGAIPNSPDAINEAPVKLIEFNTDAFAMIADFRSTKKVSSINPIFNSDASTGEIRINIRFDAAVPAGTCTYHIVRSSSIFGLKADGTPWVALN